MKTGVNHFAGEVNISKIILIGSNNKSIDITNQVILIELFEDIFSPFRTISVSVRESIDNLNSLALMGNEKMIIEYSTPQLEPIKLTIKVYQIKNLSQTKDKEFVYSIKGVTWHWNTETKSKISTTFSGNCKEIADKIMKVLLNDKSVNTPYFLEDTSNKTAFTPGFWSPIKCLNYLASNAISKNNSPSFLFYENNNGFNFTAIDSLLKAKPFQVFKRDNYIRTEDPVTTASYRDINEDYKRIVEMSIPDTGNYYEESVRGRFGTNMLTIDGLTDVYTTNPIANLISGAGTLLNNILPTGTPAPKSSIVKLSRQHSTYDDIADATNSKSIQTRMSFFSNLLKFKMLIVVPGRTDYTVGQVVELDIPKMTTTTRTSDDVDYILSGRYIISAIGHQIKRDGHFCSIELLKNSIMRQK